MWKIHNRDTAWCHCTGWLLSNGDCDVPLHIRSACAPDAIRWWPCKGSWSLWKTLTNGLICPERDWRKVLPASNAVHKGNVKHCFEDRSQFLHVVLLMYFFCFLLVLLSLCLLHVDTIKYILVIVTMQQTLSMVGPSTNWWDERCGISGHLGGEPWSLDAVDSFNLHAFVHLSTFRG